MLSSPLQARDVGYLEEAIRTLQEQLQKMGGVDTGRRLLWGCAVAHVSLEPSSIALLFDNGTQ